VWDALDAAAKREQVTPAVVVARLLEVPGA
jgi:hypothetical protein